MSAALVHGLALAFWGGILGSEAFIELLPLRKPELRPAVAPLHFYIDCFLELPALVAIVASGLVLLQGRTVDAVLALKLVGAVLAVGANLFCIGVVVVRYLGDPARVAARSRFVLASALVGFPSGALALALGLWKFLGW